MKEKVVRKENGISCQDNPSVIGKASTAGIHYQCKPFVRIKDATTGITLVALVVTIVVLLILAGITITYVFGENGVIKLAKKAAEDTNQATKAEEQGMKNLEDFIYSNTGMEKPYEKVEPKNVADWTYYEENGEITITGYKGRDTEVVIPNYINGVPVKHLQGNNKKIFEEFLRCV